MARCLVLLISCSYLLLTQSKSPQLKQQSIPYQLLNHHSNILLQQQKISEIINQTFLTSFRKSFKKRFSSSSSHSSTIEPYCPLNSKYQSTTAACCSSKHLYNLYHVQVSNGAFIGYSRSYQSLMLPPVASSHIQQLFKFQTHVTLTPDHQFNCTKYFRGTLHVIGKRSVHRIYHASK